MDKIYLILACAGKGTRAGFSENKLLIKDNGVTYLEKSLNAFYSTNLFDKILVTASSTDFETVKDIVGDKATVVLGGETRTKSVTNALSSLDGGIVLIHDGARPFVSEQIIRSCISSAKEFGGAIPVIPSADTVIRQVDGKVTEYLGKSDIFGVQTPQAFKTDLIKKAYELAGEKTFNDDGEVYKEYIGELKTVKGSSGNVKLTFPEDFNKNKPEYRFGTGFDCHKLVENRDLILGGIKIPHSKGLLGHSDADVLTHAIMDAILSSLSLRDIGYHFSDKDPRYKDVCSMLLLERVLEMVKEKGYAVQSVSATIMAEKPKLLTHIPSITKNLATALSLDPSLVGIGATTLEGLGFVGREEGICVQATATLKSI